MLKQVTTIREWFETGTKLANQAGLGREIKEKFPSAVRRTVELRICTPLPEVEKHARKGKDDWWRLYLDGHLNPGAVKEDSFCIYLDPSSGDMHIAESYQIQHKTATIIIHEKACWVLAGRVETVLSAMLKGMNVVVRESEGDLQDIEVLDDILAIFYALMRDNGHDLVALFGGM